MYSFFIIFSIFLYNLNAATIKPLKPLEASEDYTHKLVVDDDRPEQYQLFWKLLKTDEIQFEVHCKTTGWVGLGISLTGGMSGADIVIGWVKDNKPIIKDCYAEGKSTPLADTKQDYVLIDGAEINGYTILKYKRKLNTCDEKDKDIKIGTQYMIFAWNNAKPVTGNNDWIYHGKTNRFQKTLMLLSYQNETLEQQNILPSNLLTHSMTFDNLRVPVQDTYYFCDLFEVPKFEKPVHLIQFEMLVNQKNKKHVHHLLVYECEDGYVPEKPLSQECGPIRVPNNVVRNCFSKMIIAWGVGGKYNYSFPKQAGYRFEVTTRPKYFLIEMHYDNVDLKEDIIDDSGIKLYFTETLRTYDLGLLTLGADGTYLSLQLAPKSITTFTSICYPKCTEKYIPDDGIYAVSALLHTHLAGVAVKTTLVRNGVAIKELFDNPNYDFNYQFLMDIEPTKIRKGDALITQCKYNTNDRNKFTFYGYSTHDEMCFDFMYYYPKVPMVNCMSAVRPETVYNFYKSLMNEKLIPKMELKENYYASQLEIIDFFQNDVTVTPKLIQRFEDFSNNVFNKSYFCGDGTNLIYEDNEKHYTPVKNEILVDEILCNKSNEILSSSFSLFSILFSLILILI